MIKMLEIRKQLKTLMQATGKQVFYQKAAPNAVFPYLVFDISNSIDDGTLERFVLDVDGWGNDENTYDMEQMMHLADQALHRTTLYINDAGKQLGMSVYRENRLTFDENDRRVYRRRYIYQIRTHEN
jgi:hypothetical protein